MKKTFTLYLLIAITFNSYAQKEPTLTITTGNKVEVCDCPEPTKEQFDKVCVSIYQKSGAYDPKYASFSYQENLWRLACIDPVNDSKAEKARKIQCMWNKYRALFRCYGYPTSIASDANVIKFSMDTGFTPFIYESIGITNLI